MTAPRVEVQPTPRAGDARWPASCCRRLAAAQAAGREPQIALTGGDIAEAAPPRARPARPRRRRSTGPGSWSGGATSGSSPPDSPDRNAGQARAAFLDAVGATRQVHEMPSTDGRRRRRRRRGGVRRRAARARRRRVRGGDARRRPGRPRRLAVPRPPALDVDDRIAVGVTDSPKPPPERISLTFAAPQPGPRRCGSWSAARARPHAVAAALGRRGPARHPRPRGQGARRRSGSSTRRRGPPLNFAESAILRRPTPPSRRYAHAERATAPIGAAGVPGREIGTRPHGTTCQRDGVVNDARRQSTFLDLLRFRCRWTGPSPRSTPRGRVHHAHQLTWLVQNGYLRRADSSGVLLATQLPAIRPDFDAQVSVLGRTGGLRRRATDTRDWLLGAEMVLAPNEHLELRTDLLDVQTRPGVDGSATTSPTAASATSRTEILERRGLRVTTPLVPLGISAG